jgi:hypothetical protein
MIDNQASASNSPPRIVGLIAVVTTGGLRRVVAKSAGVPDPPPATDVRQAAAELRDEPACFNPRDFVTEAELRASGLTPAAVRRRCPWATEYTGIDGVSCWRLADLAALLEKGVAQ